MSAKRKTAGDKPLELSIAVKGEIVSSNFEDFKAFAESQIMAISFDLKTDEDFAQADEDAKGLKKFEGTLTQAKADALAQMDELNSLLASVDGLGEFARSTRLELERRVKARKQEVRDGIVRDGIAALEVRNREFSDMIGEAIKGKSSLVKMQEAVTETVLNINDRIRTNSILHEKAEEMFGDAVAYGRDAFVCLTVEAAKVEMERRIERHRAALKEAELKAEAARLRKEQDERDRLDRLAAQQEAERARQEKAAQEAPAPEPAPVVKESLPTAATDNRPVTVPAPSVMREETEQEERETFTKILMSAFAPVKEARKALKHRANIDRAQAFADALEAAWKTFTEEGGQ
jgi:hypothetical protein